VFLLFHIPCMTIEVDACEIFDYLISLSSRIALFTSYLQIGHWLLILSHFLMHSRWKWWLVEENQNDYKRYKHSKRILFYCMLHGKSTRLSWIWYVLMQITHSLLRYDSLWGVKLNDFNWLNFSCLFYFLWSDKWLKNK